MSNAANPAPTLAFDELCIVEEEEEKNTPPANSGGGALIRRMINGHFFWVADEAEFQRRAMPAEKTHLIVIDELAEYQQVANFIVYWYFEKYGIANNCVFNNLTHASFLYYITILTTAKVSQRFANYLSAFACCYEDDKIEDRNAFLKNINYYEKIFMNYEKFSSEYGDYLSYKDYSNQSDFLFIDESADPDTILNYIDEKQATHCTTRDVDPTTLFTSVISRVELTDIEKGRQSKKIRGTEWWFTSWGASRTVVNTHDAKLGMFLPILNTAYKKLPAFTIPESTDPTNFDSLLGLAMIVKNAGEQFEDTLRKNLPLMDFWAIYDTGSTDDTREVIIRVASELGVPGRLYTDDIPTAEFDFSVARNRVLDWMGSRCTYVISLDDTYIAPPAIRTFLEDMAGDQFADTISVFIHSNDMYYASNRIVKTTHKTHRYKYRIHEVIDTHENTNIIMPFAVACITDKRMESMEVRTKERKPHELDWLVEDLARRPGESRPYYYMAQVHQLLGNNEKAIEYFAARINSPDKGYSQELYDAIFEYARTINYVIKRPWAECLGAYNQCIAMMPNRAEPYYFIGIHYLVEENNLALAMDYFRKAFVCGNNPDLFQFGIRVTLYNYHLPFQIAINAFKLTGQYALGRAGAQRFIENIEECARLIKPADRVPISLSQMHSLYNMYKHQEVVAASTARVTAPPTAVKQDKPIAVFIADGGYKPWSGTTILTEGVGGSETYIIEMATHIQKGGQYQVYVFCNTPVDIEIFNGVTYQPLDKIWDFITHNYIHTCIVSRFIDYLPAVYMAAVENVYLVLHDIMPIGFIMQPHIKLKGIFCLSEWHADRVKQILPPFAHLVRPFYYGCANKLVDLKTVKKRKWSFIYSSFPNRGLLPLLQMWGDILTIQPAATLDVFCDLDGEWVNQNFPEQMAEIRKLLANYEDSITVQGWVDKATLAAAWRTAEFWFYPCIFEETFCLTALEAAAAGCLVITNGLAALQTTVGDRGIIIPNEIIETPQPDALEVTTTATTDETPQPDTLEVTTPTHENITPIHPLWQKRALEALTPYLNSDLAKQPKNVQMRAKLIKDNQDWVSKLTWQTQAQKMTAIWSDQYDYKLNHWGIRRLTSEKWGEIKTALAPMLETSKIWHILDINAHTLMSSIEFLRNIREPAPETITVDALENIGLSSIHPDALMASIQGNVGRYIESTTTEALKPRFQIHTGDITKSFMELMTTGGLRNFNIITYHCTSTYDIVGHLHMIAELMSLGGILILNMLKHSEQLPPINYTFNSYRHKFNIKQIWENYEDDGGICIVQFLPPAAAPIK